MKRALIAMGMALCFFGQVQAQNDDLGKTSRKILNLSDGLSIRISITFGRRLTKSMPSF